MGLNREDRVNAIAQFRYTERQARFLELVLRHGGICVPRQYATVAGIANGGEKCTALFEKLVNRHHAVASDCRHNRARVYHVHYQRLYAAIGEPESRYRRPVPSGRAMERVMLLDAVIATPSLEWLTNESDKRDCLATRTSAGQADEADASGSARARRPSNRFAGRFPIGIESGGRAVLLYVATVPWPDEFRLFVDAYAAFLRGSHEWTLRLAFPSPVDRAYDQYVSSSRVLNDALAAGKGRVECLVLTHRYRHLSPLASLVRTVAKPVEKGERVGERVPSRSQPVAPPPSPPPPSIAEQLDREWSWLAASRTSLSPRER
jgi:hypothetical protein